MDVIKSAVRDIPDFPKPGILFKDITPVLQNPQAFRAAIDTFKERYRDQKLDVIAAVESRGFLFGTVLAYELGLSLALVRKPGKLPYKAIRESYSLEYGENTLEMHEDAVGPGQRVLVIDDLLATGGTAEAAAKLVRRLGGEVVEFAFLIELSFLDGRERLSPCPIFSILQY